jgi:hypothetical protein
MGKNFVEKILEPQAGNDICHQIHNVAPLREISGLSEQKSSISPKLPLLETLQIYILFAGQSLTKASRATGLQLHIFFCR